MWRQMSDSWPLLLSGRGYSQIAADGLDLASVQFISLDLVVIFERSHVTWYKARGKSVPDFEVGDVSAVH